MMARQSRQRGDRLAEVTSVRARLSGGIAPINTDLSERAHGVAAGRMGAEELRGSC